MDNEFLRHGYEDGHIEKIFFEENNVLIEFIKWNDEKLTLNFIDCLKFSSNNPIGTEIGEVRVSNNLDLLEINFYDAWDNAEIILSIVAKDVQVIKK